MAKGLAIIVLGLALTGCVTPFWHADEGGDGARSVAYYKVKRGDTLYAIAFRFDLDYRDIARWNRIANPNRIYAGQTLRLAPPGRPASEEPVVDNSIRLASLAAGAPSASPRAGRLQRRPLTAANPVARVPIPKRRPALAPPSPAANPTVARAPTPRRPATPLAAAAAAQPESPWRWPLQGQVLRAFDPAQPGGKGIQIAGRQGQPIYAARSGSVVYSGSGLPGYGRLIIIKHTENLLSAYAYLGKINVEEGSRVKSGQTIAELGVNNENRPALHFEIRRQGKPLDPLRFLPG